MISEFAEDNLILFLVRSSRTTSMSVSRTAVTDQPPSFPVSMTGEPGRLRRLHGIVSQMKCLPDALMWSTHCKFASCQGKQKGLIFAGRVLEGLASRSCASGTAGTRLQSVTVSLAHR